MTRRLSRFAAAAAIAGAVVALGVVFFGSSSSHVLHVQFTDAGQLVTGDRVTVATRPIGKIAKLSLTPDGLADAKVEIDDAAWPLHVGTRAEIRLASQVGVANRYIAITPGDVRAPQLGDGAVVDTRYTRGVVDIDETLDDFTPKVRHDLRAVLNGSEEAIDGIVPQAQASIDLSAPALAQSRVTLGELAASPKSLTRLLHAGGQVSSTLARNATALTDGIDRTATLLRAVARQRTALSGVLTRAPVVLPAATRTLRNVRASLDRSVRPTLRRLLPVAKPLARVLEGLPLAAQLGVPLIGQVRALLPPTTRALRIAPSLATAALPALRQAAKSIEVSQDQFSGLRQYAPDAIQAGALIFGEGTGYYDANGHYIRFTLEDPDDEPGSGLDPITGAPTAGGYSTGHHSPCPGGATQPAPDRSNPRIEDPSLCNPKDDLK